LDKNLVENITQKIRLELEQIDELCETYPNLLQSSRQDVPDPTELAAMASVLHSFYCGVENIFALIAKRLDQDLPDSPEWHSELINRMSQPRINRPQVISETLRQALSNYLGFRHFHRHSYSFRLKWERMDVLVTGLLEIRDRLKSEVNKFLDDLQANQQ
jgi:hypothetical protein